MPNMKRNYWPTCREVVEVIDGFLPVHCGKVVHNKYNREIHGYVLYSLCDSHYAKEMGPVKIIGFQELN